MLIYKEFRAWIEISGVEAKEYAIRKSRNAQGIDIVTCWIASEEGKQFAIKWIDTLASSDVVAGYSVDGTIVRRQLNHARMPNVIISQDGFVQSATKTRPFVFSRIKLTDNDQYLENSVSEHFGDIRIEFRRCTIVGPGRPLLVTKPVEMLNDPIHERRKKATTHRIGAGASVAHHPLETSQTIDGPVFVEFIFKYRTIDQLIANDIASAPPRAVKKRSAVDEDVIEIEDSEEEQAKAEAVLAKIISRRAKKKVKREPEDIKPVFLPGEVIDLT